MSESKTAEALRGILNHYVRLVESGDAGNWDAEKEPEVIAAREALSAHDARKDGGVSDALVERAIDAAKKADTYPGFVGYRKAAMRAALEAAGCGVDADAVREVAEWLRTWPSPTNKKMADKLIRALGV